MHLIIKRDDLYYLVLPYNLKNQEEESIIKKIKEIFLKYNKKYNLLEPGFYEVLVYNHDIVGTIIVVEKIDSFEFSEEVDLKIIIKNKIKLYLRLLDETDFPNYRNDIDIDSITYKDYLKLVEHSKIIIGTKKVLT